MTFLYFLHAWLFFIESYIFHKKTCRDILRFYIILSFSREDLILFLNSLFQSGIKMIWNWAWFSIRNFLFPIPFSFTFEGSKQVSGMFVRASPHWWTLNTNFSPSHPWQPCESVIQLLNLSTLLWKFANALKNQLSGVALFFLS